MKDVEFGRERAVTKLNFRVATCRRCNSGFTLVELMVVVAIIAILTLIAVPAYQDQMKKTRRTDAKTALTDIANRQEKFFSNNSPPHYTATINGAWPSGLGYSVTSQNGYYDLTVATTSNGYTATATAKSSGPQAQDSKCLSMTIDALGNRSPAGCW